jgi:sec-independent protein translocase protein TatA
MGEFNVVSILALIGSPIQMLVVGALILLLFGHRLPSTMRSLGKGLTEFKKGLREEDEEEAPKLEDKGAEAKF